ncbi:hypothetical protein B0T19DRAFT_402763 [Cercophora scortea]|uniref:Uncharacterized protein n=1 Tax=Cercophora scortea TaxID=314031 RepID=A0AAE0IGY9_9PEZI|nr:hypothetical protein B0T19DRAFT_402763 [Cercophora scortea]
MVATPHHRGIEKEIVQRILSLFVPEPPPFLSRNEYPYQSLQTTLLSYSFSQQNLCNVSLLHNHKQLYSLFRTLVEWPHLARHLVIELVNPPPPESMSEEWLDNLPAEEVCRLALLKDIMTSALAERNGFPGFLPQLQTFQLRVFGTFLYREMPDIISHLGAFPRLHTVELAGALVDGTHSNPHFESLFACKNLTRLEIAFCDPLGVLLLQPVTPIKATLTRLLKTHRARLTRVSLTWWNYNMARGDVDAQGNLIQQSHTVDGIDALSQLEHLEIDLHCLFGRSLVWSKIPDVLALRITEVIPRSLKSLCLFEVWRDLPFHLDVQQYSDNLVEALVEPQRSLLARGRALLTATRRLVVDRVLFDLYKNLESFPALKTIVFVPIQYPDGFTSRELHHYEFIFKFRQVEFKALPADRLTRMKWRPERC